jgi:hypothetical protein
MHRATKTLLCIGQEICAHLARYSFPELGLAQSLSQSVTTTCTYLYKFLTICTEHLQTTLALSLSAMLLISPRYLFILYKIGLNMGKPMGRHPIPVTYSQIPKRTQKGAEISQSLLHLALHLQQAVEVPK